MYLSPSIRRAVAAKRLHIPKRWCCPSRPLWSLQSQEGPSTQQSSHKRELKEERLKKYRSRGLLPAQLGDEFHQGRYKVVNKLGHGSNSTTWLARDVRTQEHVALKIRSARSSEVATEREAMEHITRKSHDADADSGSQHVLTILDSFEHDGEQGKHVCLVLKPMGPVVSEYRWLFPQKRIPVPIVKRITRQVLEALVFLHDQCGVIHTAIMPQNILMGTPRIDKMFRETPSERLAPRVTGAPGVAVPSMSKDFRLSSEKFSSGYEDLQAATDISVRLADFGLTRFNDKSPSEMPSSVVRIPEVVLNTPWNHKVDIWKLGLLTWDLIHGEVLFAHQAKPNKRVYLWEEDLAELESVLEPMPRSLLQRSQLPDSTAYSGSKGKRISFSPWKLRDMCNEKGVLSGQELENFLSFTRSALSLDPEGRPEARELLQTPWLRDS